MDYPELRKRRQKNRPNTLFYMDPPYWQTEGYGVGFGIEQYEKMAEILGRLKGKAIISLNDHPDIRRIFAGYHIETTDIRYTVGGGKGSEASEVLIFSWDVEAEPQVCFDLALLQQGAQREHVQAQGV